MCPGVADEVVRHSLECAHGAENGRLMIKVWWGWCFIFTVGLVDRDT